MSTSDSPDYQNVVMLSSGAVTDAPDWQEVIVGPGGAPVGSGTPFTWGPANYGWAGWTTDPAAALSDQILLATGHVILALFYVATTATVTHLVWASFGGAGITPIANESFMGLYSAPGSGSTPTAPALLATTTAGAMDAQIPVPGIYANALSVSLAVTAGTVLYAAFLCNTTSSASALSTGQALWDGTVLQQIKPGFLFPSQNYSSPLRTTLPASLGTPTNGGVYSMGSPWMAAY